MYNTVSYFFCAVRFLWSLACIIGRAQILYFMRQSNLRCSLERNCGQISSLSSPKWVPAKPLSLSRLEKETLIHERNPLKWSLVYFSGYENVTFIRYGYRWSLTVARFVCRCAVQINTLPGGAYTSLHELLDVRKFAQIFQAMYEIPPK